MPDATARWRELAPILLPLLTAGWLFGTPYFLYGAAIIAAPFFGEQPTPTELSQARLYLYAGLLCGFLLPTIGIAAAAAARLRATAWLFALQLALTTTALLWLTAR